MEYFLSQDFVAGYIAGIAGIVATQPLDTIRIRCQVFKSHNKSISQHFHAIRVNEGIRGLFRGVAAPTLSVGLMNAILFQTYETSKTIIYSYTNTTSYLNIFISGTIAGSTACIITAPTELFKLMVQQKTCVHSATMKQEYVEAVSLYKTFGLRNGIYRGFGVTVLRDSFSLGLYFLSYEWFMNQYDAERKTQIVPFIGGGIAGLLSWSFAYPLDHIKTYYQLKLYEYGVLPLRNAIMDHIRREGGVLSIYKGLSATLLRCTPQHAVLFVCYENVKKMMERYNIS